MRIDQWNEMWPSFKVLKVNRPADLRDILVYSEKDMNDLYAKVVKALPLVASKEKVENAPPLTQQLINRVRPVTVYPNKHTMYLVILDLINPGDIDTGQWDCNPMLNTQGQFVYWDRLIKLCNELLYESYGKDAITIN